jgi:hypothetical protein
MSQAGFKPMTPMFKQLNMDLKPCSHCDWTGHSDKIIKYLQIKTTLDSITGTDITAIHVIKCQIYSTDKVLTMAYDIWTQVLYGLLQSYVFKLNTPLCFKDRISPQNIVVYWILIQKIEKVHKDNEFSTNAVNSFQNNTYNVHFWMFLTKIHIASLSRHCPFSL